jgi:hypothetical protein
MKLAKASYDLVPLHWQSSTPSSAMPNQASRCSASPCAIAAISWRHCKARPVSTTTAKSSSASSPAFQLKHEIAHPVDDLVHQYHYVGVAPGV